MPQLRHRSRLASLVCATLTACQAAGDYRADADRAVYAILEQRRAELFQHEGGFTIDPPADSLRQRLLRGESVDSLDLVEAMEVASENSRDYQRRKETLYRVALDLTLARYSYQVQKSGELGALLAGDGNGADTASVDGGFALTKLLGSGALIIGDMGLSLARTLSTGDDWDLSSTLGLSVTQPLLRGFGARIVKEPLTQAERDVVYEVRSFERFRRTFAVDVANRFYRILQQRDVVTNEELNYTNLQQLRERNEELATAGRLSDIQVDQARQDELRSKNNLIEQRQRLAGLFDDFKLFLGLPIETEIDLASDALDDLTREDQPLLDERTAIDVALRERLDYLTALDVVDDLERKVFVAADELRAQLDVNTTVLASSVEGSPLEYHQDDLTWSLGATLDLPLNRLRERNVYRATLIDHVESVRSAEELADTIRTDLRDSLREAQATLETLEIQRNAVRLAERRVESTRLNLEAGRADTRDILEAQDALVEAQNAVTAARIDHHLARLALWRDVEALRVDEGGIRLVTDFAPPDQSP